MWFGTPLEAGTRSINNPTTGRFTQEDPIGLAGGVNLYGFAAGDPVNFSDPFGLCGVAGAAISVAQGAALGAVTGSGYSLRGAAIDAAMGAACVGMLRKLGTIGRFAARNADDAGRSAINANKLNHIFGKARHNLDDVVAAAGSREVAYEGMQRGVQSALDAGDLVTDARGVFSQVVNVAGHDVTVTGRVVDGVARIGTAFIP